jgi:succinate dehydrogenase/fumarate reductase cytochrome b subunit
VALAGLIYHFFAGIKHLVMDFGVAEELQSGRTDGNCDDCGCCGIYRFSLFLGGVI